MFYFVFYWSFLIGHFGSGVAWLFGWLLQELIQDLGIYIVSFDRPGYGESDPDPKRTLKSSALDIEELADQLELGSKFYVVGFSMGGQIIWPLLKYIPHRYAWYP